MRVRGFLKTQDGIYPLSPKITTVGREGCDFLIQNNGVDFQHATIEYCEMEDIFVLKDLDSEQGTFVNDCRIQHASVRLTPGDWIRFGQSGSVYEFIVERSSSSHASTPTARGSWQPLPVISNSVQETYSNSSNFQNGNLPTWAQTGHITQLPRPPPSTSRLGRPLSAGASARRSCSVTVGPSQPSQSPLGPSAPIHSSMSNRGRSSLPVSLTVDVCNVTPRPEVPLKEKTDVLSKKGTQGDGTRDERDQPTLKEKRKFPSSLEGS